jgi:predicted nucleic acid-binding protein
MNSEEHDNTKGGQQRPPFIFLLDNNMIQHLLNKEAGPHLKPLLEEIEKAGARLAVSQIVVYESLKAIIFNPEKSEVVIDFFEKSIKRYPVSEEVLVNAARLHELYGSDEYCRTHRSSISTEDVIIATTSITLGAYVMTCDANDFPAPFFKESHRQYIYYAHKGRRKHVIVYIFQPDAEAIEAGLNKLNPVKSPESSYPY